MNLGKSIKMALVIRGMSQKDLAHELDVNRATVQNWCANNTEPKQGMVNKIAQALTMTTSYLISLGESTDSGNANT